MSTFILVQINSLIYRDS